MSSRESLIILNVSVYPSISEGLHLYLHLSVHLSHKPDKALVMFLSDAPPPPLSLPLSVSLSPHFRFK